MALTAKEVQTLYAGYLGRPADFEGLKYWLGNTTQVTNIEELAQSFYDSAEGKKLYPDNDVTNNINAIYMNLFNRTPDTAGYDYWFNEIVSGKINLAKAVVAIYYGAIGNDKVIAENKVNAAVAFTDQVAASDTASLYYGDKAFASAQSFLATVGETPATAQQIAAAVAASENQSSANGETFTLTTVEDFASTGNSYHDKIADTFKFTGNNEIIEASNATLKTGSVTLLDGSASDNDVLNVAMSDDLPLGDNTATITLENIESISLNNSKVGAEFSFAGATVSGLKNIVATGKGIVIDASGYDKNGLNISGGAGDDVLKGTKNADVFTGGAGQDKFNISASTVLNLDTIADFDKATDKDKIVVGLTVSTIAKHTTDKTTLTDVLSELAAGEQAQQTIDLTSVIADAKQAAVGATLTIAGVTFTAIDNTGIKFKSSDSSVEVAASTLSLDNIVSLLNAEDSSLWSAAAAATGNTLTLTSKSDGKITTPVTATSSRSGQSAVTATASIVKEGENHAIVGSFDAVWFELDNSTYVVVDTNSNDKYDAADNVVALTGTNLDLATTDFVTA